MALVYRSFELAFRICMNVVSLDEKNMIDHKQQAERFFLTLSLGFLDALLQTFDGSDIS